jgi:hypothetical protein
MKSRGCIAATIGVLACGMLLVGCQSNSQSHVAQWDEDVSQARAEFSENTRLVAEFKAMTPAKCDAPGMARATHMGNMIEARTAKYYRALDDDPNKFSNVERNVFLDTIITLNPMAIGAKFNAADAYLAAGCLDPADQIYRDILATYTGSSFASVRERAKVGIDDVRAKKTSG